MISNLHIIYASTTGNTEYVVSLLKEYLEKKEPNLKIEFQRCELATAEDLHRGDVLLLASGTWNTGGVEGQLNHWMYDYLIKVCKDVDLKEIPVGMIALGDDRYFYTSRAGEHLRNFIQSHNGKVLGQPLTIINDPYSQEEKIEKWGDKLLGWLKEL